MSGIRSGFAGNEAGSQRNEEGRGGGAVRVSNSVREWGRLERKKHGEDTVGIVDALRETSRFGRILLGKQARKAGKKGGMERAGEERLGRGGKARRIEGKEGD